MKLIFEVGSVYRGNDRCSYTELLASWQLASYGILLDYSWDPAERSV